VTAENLHNHGSALAERRYRSIDFAVSFAVV
jgi:hypothetical protein